MNDFTNDSSGTANFATTPETQRSPFAIAARSQRRPPEIHLVKVENGWIISVHGADRMIQYVTRDIQQATALIESIAKDFEKWEVNI